MCKIYDATECEKSVRIKLKNGATISSKWFQDHDKITAANEVNKTEAEDNQLCIELKKRNLTRDDVLEWNVLRKKEDDGLYITDHAFQRAKERLGWNRKTMMRMMKKVYDNGTADKDVKGSLAPWVKSRMERYNAGERSIMYGNTMFVLCRNTVVTVINAPSKKRVENKICGKRLKDFTYAEAF